MMSGAHTSTKNQKKKYSNVEGEVPIGRGGGTGCQKLTLAQKIRKNILQRQGRGTNRERGGGEREREREVSNVDGSCVGVTGHRRKLFGCCGLRRVDSGRSDKPTTTTRGGGRVWTLEVAGLGFSNFHFLI